MPPVGQLVFIVFGEIWKDVFVSGILPPASQSKTASLSPHLSSLLIMMPEYAGAHIFILITIFLLSCCFYFSLPSFCRRYPSSAVREN